MSPVQQHEWTHVVGDSVHNTLVLCLENAISARSGEICRNPSRSRVGRFPEHLSWEIDFGSRLHMMSTCKITRAFTV